MFAERYIPIYLIVGGAIFLKIQVLWRKTQTAVGNKEETIVIEGMVAPLRRLWP